MASGLTGMVYAPKLPLPDGTVYACYGYGSVIPYTPPPLSEEEQKRQKEEEYQQEIERIQEEIDQTQEDIERTEQDILDSTESLAEHRRRLANLQEELAKKTRKKPKGLLCAPIVAVPEGAVEWLFHEVGHWIAATPGERVLPNYGLGAKEARLAWGHGADREWQAWAFEEIVLAPYGRARELAAPSYRGGVGYSKAGPIPVSALDHIGQRLRTLGIDIEPWRLLAGEWVRWGRSRGVGRSPWESEA